MSFNQQADYAFYRTDFLFEKIAVPVGLNSQVIGYLPIFTPSANKLSKARYVELKFIDINAGQYSSGQVPLWDSITPSNGLTAYFEGTRLNDLH